MPGTVGVGVIGVGFMGRTHIASYARTAGCTLRAVCDPAQKAAAAGNLATTGDDALFAARHGEATRANALRFLTFDAAYPSSILSCLRAARENARSV
ncbi:MAG: alpha-E domain-containing protein, partial [Phycisphaerales bacterium]